MEKGGKKRKPTARNMRPAAGNKRPAGKSKKSAPKSKKQAAAVSRDYESVQMDMERTGYELDNFESRAPVRREAPEKRQKTAKTRFPTEIFKDKTIMFPILSLFVICLAATLLLSVTNLITETKIADQIEKEELTAKKAVLSIADSFEDKSVDTGKVSFAYFQGLSETGDPVGYVFISQTKGYGGKIRVMTGMDFSGKITGVRILESNETPGLGLKAGDDDFISQYLGKKDPLLLVKSNPTGVNEIQAITGATITSAAVTNAVNEARTNYVLAAAAEGRKNDV